MNWWADEWVLFGLVGGSMVALFVVCVCCCDGSPEEYVGRRANAMPMSWAGAAVVDASATTVSKPGIGWNDIHHRPEQFR